MGKKLCNSKMEENMKRIKVKIIYTKNKNIIKIE
jgi:hypothetical protein